METFYKESYVINVLKCNAFEHWDKIRIGSFVTFETYNANDEHSSKDVDKDLIRVILTYNDGDKEIKATIGMLPEEEYKFMKDIIKNGWTDIFEGVICKKVDDAQYDQRISVAVYIKKNR